jgi:uncharacterized protein (DUF2267 family)
MALNFESYISKGNEMVNRVATELEVPRDQGARILRSTLKALRNQLTLEENFDLLAQLPMIIKAVYVDGWNPTKYHMRAYTLADFFDDIRSNDGDSSGYDFGNDVQTYSIVKRVFKVLSEYISEGEWDDIKSVVPKPLKKLLTLVEQDMVF